MEIQIQNITEPIEPHDIITVAIRIVHKIVLDDRKVET
jgi:hypothetical protein